MRNLKTLSFLAVIAIAATLQIAPAGAQDKPAVNIGLVDMERIFGEFYKTKLAEDEVEEVKAIIKSEVDERRTTHAGMLKEYESLVKKIKDPTLTESVRKGHQAKAEAKGAELRALDAEMKEYAERRRKQLIEQVETSKAKILNEISQKINEVATADGYDVVFDRSGLSERGFPLVMFVSKDNDLSEKVVKNLNANAPKSATPAKTTE